MSQKKKRRQLLMLLMRCIIWLGTTFFVGVLVWPSFTNARYSIEQVSAIGGYDAGIQRKSEAEQDEMLRAARKYNEKIAEQQQRQPFIYSPTYEDELYDSILRVNADSNIMGYLEAPTGKVYLPIAHGTSDADLAFEAGHLYGTSVPVGGPSTHSVIAAHTGLPEADLFTHLTDMQEGDEFYIHVLNETLIYEVDNIRIVLPEEGNDHLQVEDGKDLITLYTCTPYGVNSHRLLVRGTRTGTVEKEIVQGERVLHTTRDQKAIIQTACWGAIPVVVFIIGAVITFRRPKKRRRKP